MRTEDRKGTEKVHYIIYQITNKVNGKIYVGMHQTRNLDDGYMGSGLAIGKAIEKYGLENFKKEILCECSSFDEMNKKEAEIVNSEFVAREDTYNLSVGGTYGWENVNKVMRKDPERFKLMQLHAAEALRKVCKTTEHRQKMSEIKKRYFELHDGAFTGKNHSEETKRKMSESHKRNGKHCGEKNGSYGKHWWMNPETGESKSFGEDEVVPEGWIRGRRCNVSEEGRKIMSKMERK